MKTLDDWLSEYQRSHVNPLNRKFHFVCIPLIVFSVFGALRSIPAGGDALNAAVVVAALALLYYARLSWRLALGVAAVFALMYAGVLALQNRVGPGLGLLKASAAIFVVGWIGQFIGHHIEGARPSFFKDLQFLLIGPLWEMAHLYRLLGLKPR